MEKVKLTICYHPELRPTDWNQPKPEPCEMILTCDCGANRICRRSCNSCSNIGNRRR